MPAVPVALPTQPDLLGILLANSSMHHPAVVAKLLQTSKALSARMAAALAGRMNLSFGSSSTEAVMSLSRWLSRHAPLLASLELSVKVCCCAEDEAGADTAITEALAATASTAPSLRIRSFSTTSSKPQLVSPRYSTLPCLQHITHLSIPDLTSEQQVGCLPPRLVSLDVASSCSCNVGRLQQISQQCPALREVRLGYNLWPSKTNTGSLLLDKALNGWVLLPVVELRFIGCRLPRCEWDVAASLGALREGPPQYVHHA